ncbi:MAG: molybdopterin cofactor-binding domain-containing protein [Ignavibacteriaceae bacterium]
MKNYDSEKHVKGESQFVDDINPPRGILYGYVFYSTVAHGKIRKLDISKALAVEGIKGVLTANDIPGENQIGGIIQDEELLASGEVHFIGEPIALVVAVDQITAHKGAKAIVCEFEKLPVITDPREAAEKGELIIPPKVFALGDVDSTWAKCDVIVEGNTESGGQEHLYLETQGAFAYPVEDGGVKVISSTQGPTAVQRVTARILGLPMHKVEVDVLRLGGGFGGKEDQASPWGALAALASFKLNNPVKLILPRQEDMRMTGKRHPYSSDFKIGLTSDGKILAYEASYYQNAGAAADLSTAVLERTLFHATNSYFVPNVKTTAYSCRTNLPPNTAFRGFGGPQGMFVIESAIHKAASVLGVDPSVIQKKNLLKEGDEFSYGQIAEYCRAERCYKDAEERYNINEIRKLVDDFNKGSKMVKKGVALMPVCFGISFTSTFMNQASALVHIYTDGSVRVSTAAVEMGQGVNAKIHSVVQRIFSIDPESIKIDTTNTSRIANTSPTAASKGADLNGYATQNACEIILNRLRKVAADELKIGAPEKIEIRNEVVFYSGNKTELTWKKLIQSAYLSRVSLSVQAHYATPHIYFDKEKSKGHAFAYHVYGTAIIEVTVNCLLGIYEIDSVKVVHDFGESLHPAVDKGQAEGGIAQGIGWMTVEEVIYNNEGKLLTDALSTYKVPDIHAAPKEMLIHFLEDAPNPYGPFKSKAIGEPPLMYGIGAYFAITNAMKAFRPEKEFKYHAPMTPERVLLSIYDSETLMRKKNKIGSETLAANK